MDKKIEEAQQEFNAILHYIVHVALGREIHEVEAGIYRGLLRLGRILLELFVVATGTGRTGETLMRDDGGVFRYLRDSGCKYLSIFGEITIVRAHYAREGERAISVGRYPESSRTEVFVCASGLDGIQGSGKIL